MKEKAEIINKVDQSGLITLNLEDYYDQGKRVFIDLKDHLTEGLILRERDFRNFVKSNDWAQVKFQFSSGDVEYDALTSLSFIINKTRYHCTGIP